MLVKYMTAGVAASALLATVAFAQSPTTTTDRTGHGAGGGSTTSVSFQGDWRASKMVGLNVYNDKNESIGSINEMLTDKSGNIKAVVLGVGGFLGVGEHWSRCRSTRSSSSTSRCRLPPRRARRRPPAPVLRPRPRPVRPRTNTAPASKSNPWYPDHAVFNATKDQLKAMPEFKYST